MPSYKCKYTPTPRNPVLVPPQQINIMKLPEYVPEKHEPARPGADDHLKYLSKGDAT